jgi:hypothetical protein
MIEYIEARSSACYQISKEFAAARKVDMERAWYELEEHRLQCAAGGEVLARFAKENTSNRLKRSAA